MSLSSLTRMSVLRSALRASKRMTSRPGVRLISSSGLSPRDPQNQAKKAGKEAKHHSDNPLDAASSKPKAKPDQDGQSGNKEGLGFADQVGSQSHTAKKDRNSK